MDIRRSLDSRRGILLTGLALFLVATPALGRKKKTPPPPPPPAAKPDPVPPPLGPALLPVAVAGNPASAHWAAVLQHAGEEAARRGKKNELLSAVDAFDPKAAAARAAAFKDGRNQLKAAHGAFDEHDLDVSGIICEKAFNKLIGADLTQHFPELLDAWELKIAILAADPKSADRVKSELAQLLALDPHRQLSPKLFKPDVIQLAGGMAKGVQDSLRLGMTVTSPVAPAEIYVDGVYRGISPVDVKQLAPGSHFLAAAAPGFHLAQSKVNASDAKAEIKLEPAEQADQYQAFATGISSGLKSGTAGPVAAKLGSSVKAEQVLVLMAEKTGEPKGMIHAEMLRVGVPAGNTLNDIKDNLSDTESFFASAGDVVANKALADDPSKAGSTPAAGSSHSAAAASPPPASPAPAAQPSPTPAPAPAPPPPSKPAAVAATPAPQPAPAPPPPAPAPAPTAAAAPQPAAQPASAPDTKRPPPKDLGEDIKE